MAQPHPSVPAEQVIAPPRPAHATDRYDGPTILYRMFDADDQLLYVGVTCNPPRRWEGHRKNSSWWKLVARRELVAYPDRTAALTAERQAIRTEHPIHNVSSNPHKNRQHVHAVLKDERADRFRALARCIGLSFSDTLVRLIDEATGLGVEEAGPMSAPTTDPSDLDVAIRVAQQLLDSDQLLSVREALRLLLRALDAEPSARSEQPAPANRCPAAHPDDPTPCDGPPAVTVLDRTNAGADGCEHHGARLLAALDGGRVYALPHAGGAAIRVFKAAATARPYAWVDGGERR